jgi:aryl-alcohol dehydrogenase-like predicted oxidoreductase
MTGQIETLEMNMQLVDIPGTSLNVSPIALGTWAIGGWMWGGSDEAEAIRTIHELSIAASR